MIQFDAIISWLNYLVSRTGMMLSLAFFSATFRLLIAIMVNYLRHRQILNRLLYVYIDLFRGTPLLLQLSMMYYAIPRLLSGLINTLFGLDLMFQLSPFQAASVKVASNTDTARKILSIHIS